MRSILFAKKQGGCEIRLFTNESWESESSSLTTTQQSWAKANGFEGQAEGVLLVPNESGEIAEVFVGLGEQEGPWSMGSLANALPEGEYCFTDEATEEQLYQRAYAWALGAYRFSAYKQHPVAKACCILPPCDWSEEFEALVESVYLVRDLINMPAQDMGPADLAEAVIQVGKELGASTQTIVGDDLLTQNYPMIHAVGKGAESSRAPRLVELTWGDNPDAPLIALVGKGVCFDTGGLDIKPSSGMLNMKKDMGGAAHALALARMLMIKKLPIRLRLLIPCVENSVSGASYRPKDVLTARDGTTVEVTNTDAEGRLVLADALSDQVESNPALLINFATLTGAGKVALGPDVPALMAHDRALAENVQALSWACHDPVWQLPLLPDLKCYLNSDIADLCNAALNVSGYGGSITAGLFLARFVPKHIPWLHLDLMGANTHAKPGRPKGGEAQSLRAMFHFCCSFVEGRSE